MFYHAEGMPLWWYNETKYTVCVYIFGLLILDDEMTDEDDPFYDDKVSKRLINGSSSKDKARVSWVVWIGWHFLGKVGTDIFLGKIEKSGSVKDILHYNSDRS